MTDGSGNTGGQPVKQEQQQQQQQPARGKNGGGRRNNRQQHQRPACKSKVIGLESAVFSAKGAAAAFSNNVIAIADYVVGPETKHQYEVGTAIRTRKPQAISEPTDPGKDASSSELKKYEILFKEWVVRTAKYDDQLKSAFPLVLGLGLAKVARGFLEISNSLLQVSSFQHNTLKVNSDEDTAFWGR